MFARVSSYRGDVDALTQGFNSVTEPLRHLGGLRGAYFLVDRASDRAMSVTLWETEDALKVSAEQADQLRDDATQPSGATIESVESFEVVVTV
jgi:heme-degrading monooxygenase HmoA